MPALFISRTSIPAPTRGKLAATEPKLAISEMGGVRLNGALLAKLAGSIGLYLSWDADTRKVVVTALKELIKGVTQADLFPIQEGKKGKGQSTIPGLAPFLRMQGYDFKESGNQSFLVEGKDTKAGYQFNFTLPLGALTPTPKSPRKPRTPKAPATPTPAVADAVSELI